MDSAKFYKMLDFVKKIPTGAIKEDFTDVTFEDQFNEDFLKRVAKYLVDNGMEVNS